MVGLVIVSHSQKLAEGVVDATKIMADGCPIAAAGGMEGGDYGTSYDKIAAAIGEVRGADGALILVDMGSAVMTSEMVLEDLGFPDVEIVDCPIAEGAIAASLEATCGGDLASVKAAALAVRDDKKL